MPMIFKDGIHHEIDILAVCDDGGLTIAPKYDAGRLALLETFSSQKTEQVTLILDKAIKAWVAEVANIPPSFTAKLYRA